MWRDGHIMDESDEMGRELEQDCYETKNCTERAEYKIHHVQSITYRDTQNHRRANIHNSTVLD
jgi:hypothetical protein